VKAARAGAAQARHRWGGLGDEGRERARPLRTAKEAFGT
jgi:hypothetical protein